MTKNTNDIFKYEKQWQIFKGNEYMSNLLNRMRPKISSTCPKSYIDYQKMPKNHLSSVTKEHERLLQNSILQRKLDLIVNRQITKAYYLTDQYRAQSIQAHKNNYRKALEESHRSWENKNLYKRITESKSFFSRSKKYYQYCNTSKQKLKKNSSMLNIKTHSLFDDTNNNTTKVFPSLSSHTKFNYLDLNEELIDTKKKSIEIYKKKHYIDDFALVTLRYIYLYNRLIIVIEPYSSYGQNIFLIIINDEENIKAFNNVFKDFNLIAKAIKFDKETFSFKKKSFNYITHTMLKETFQLMEKNNEFAML